MPDRGQLSLSVVEAGVGVLLLLAVAGGFGASLPTPSTDETQLDAYAGDAATVLTGAPPRHADRSRLTEVAASRAAFERERGALRRRVAATLGDNLQFRLRTPHGVVGDPIPRATATGRATVPTRHGPVVIQVWYA
ncbi:hypothetical protein [Halobaculum sp. MBLA0143]|uniref:DUF7262 family protein n=1 Tax=Halobaculum sp. MBLA0143 TaxID=3079933 RepID=UPI0035261D56